jgi:hypothetical protein
MFVKRYFYEIIADFYFPILILSLYAWSWKF